MFIKILCVGVFGNENTYILAALIKKFIEENSPRERFFIKCVGMEEESVRGYPPCKSFHTVMNSLGFLPSGQAYHPSIERDAKKENLTPIYWYPTSIQSVNRVEQFDIFITPYHNVFKKLETKRYTKDKELLLVCNPTGIGLDCCPTNAAEKMWPWVKNYLNNR